MNICHTCGRQFSGLERLDLDAILHEYLNGKQTYGQFGERHGCSAWTVQRLIDRAIPRHVREFSRRANVVMDTTYFGRVFGVMVFKDSTEA